MAGLHLNLQKSNIFLASTTDDTKQAILAATGLTVGVLPFRYLGIPLSSTRLRTSDYSVLTDAIGKKIKSWPRHSLSYVGKIELVRSVLQGIECFWLSILSVPMNVIHSIYALCRKFIWPTKHPPISSSFLFRPKEEGGFGLKNLLAWNHALIAKILWKIHMKKDSLWIKWVGHTYNRFGTVWEWDKHKEYSPLIKQVITIRDQMIQRLGYVALAQYTIEKWFGGNGGLPHAYSFFVKPNGQWPWKPLIWKPFLLPKHRFILWLFAHGKLMTRDRQCYVQDKTCVFCAATVESMHHLFFQCPLSSFIWNGIRDWLGMKKLMGSGNAIIRAYRSVYKGNAGLARLRSIALAATIYHVWNARNRALFDKEVVNVDSLIMKIKLFVRPLVTRDVYEPSRAEHCQAREVELFVRPLITRDVYEPSRTLPGSRSRGINLFSGYQVYGILTCLDKNKKY